MPAKIIASHHVFPTRLPATGPPPSPPPLTYKPSKLGTAVPQAISIAAPGLPSPKVQDGVAAPPDDAIAAYWDYQFLFVSQRTETAGAVPLRPVDGALPQDFPSGTYYLTGPGMFADDHGSTVHPLDGHGYLRAFRIDPAHGTVEFTARYIETEAQTEEMDRETGEWRFTHRGPFSVLKGGKMIGNTKVMKNVANTSVLYWAGRLFCLWEGGDPYEIEPKTLATIGTHDITNRPNPLPKKDHGGNMEAASRPHINFLDMATQILKPILHGVFKMPSKRLLSHYKIDVRRNRLLIMSCNAEDMLLPRSNFTFYEFDSNFKLVQSQEFSIPDHLMIHDWAFTDSHYILFGNRIKLDVVGSVAAVCGMSPMISALSLNPSKTTTPIYLLPRSGGGSGDWRVPIEAPSQMWVLHVANASERRDLAGNLAIRIQASSCSYSWFNFQKMFGYDWQSGKLDPSMMNPNQELLPHLVYVDIKLDKNSSCVDCNVSGIDQWGKPSDFPIINQDYSGRKNDYVYAATSFGARRDLPHFPFDTVVKVNNRDGIVQTWSTSRRRFIGEPIFISRGRGGQEDDGYLLVVEYAVAIQRCYLVVLDAKLVGKKGALVARFEVPRHLNFPLGFHGFWAATTASAKNGCDDTSIHDYSKNVRILKHQEMTNPSHVREPCEIGR